jgi:2-isopropylmalate synthase
MSLRIEIFDTTLRDGNKLPFIALSVPERLEIARQLARLGVDVIDAGYPAASAEDREAVLQIGREVDGPYVSALCRAIERDVAETLELLQAVRRPCLHIFMPASVYFLQNILKKSPQEVLRDVQALMRLARGSPTRLQFSLSEVAEADPQFLREVMETAVGGGADAVNVADTNGTLFPAEVAELVRGIRKACGSRPEVRVGVHCHNDLGLATAGTLAAVEAGADHVEVTVGGIGDRAGNAPLEEVVIGLELLAGRLDVAHSVHLDQIHPTARLLSRILGLQPHPNKPIIGKCAFRENRDSQARKALPERKEKLLRAATIGHPREVTLAPVVVSQSGLRRQLKALGISLEGVDLEKVYRLYQSHLRSRSEITLPELESMVQNARPAACTPYTLRSFSVMTGSDVHPVGVVEIEHQGVLSVQASPGNGPVHALCRAVDRAVGVAPRMILYSVDALTEDKDARAEVTVTLIYQGRRFHGHYSSTDVIEASLRSYLDAVNRLAASGVRESPGEFYVEGEYLWE